MDSSITPLRHGGLSLVQTTDFFYPLVEDPYMQGKTSFLLTSLLYFMKLVNFFLVSVQKSGSKPFFLFGPLDK